MGMAIELQTESGELIESYGDIEQDELPGFSGLSYPYLRLIDFYGVTYFSSYQMEHAVLAELERWVPERPSAGAGRLLEAGRRCANSGHAQVRLEGD
jgi:hypothetical protein